MTNNPIPSAKVSDEAAETVNANELAELKEFADRIERTCRLRPTHTPRGGIYDCVTPPNMVVIDCFYDFEVQKIIATLRNYPQQPQGRVVSENERQARVDIAVLRAKKRQWYQIMGRGEAPQDTEFLNLIDVACAAWETALAAPVSPVAQSELMGSAP